MNLNELIWPDDNTQVSIRAKQLNPNTPISDSIVSLIVMDKGIPFDIVRGKFLSSQYGSAKTKINRDGKFVTDISVANSAYEEASTEIVPTTGSIAVVVRSVGTPIADGAIFEITHSSDSAAIPYVAFALKYYNPSTSMVFSYNIAGTIKYISASASVSSTSSDCFAGTIKSGEQKFYKNGAQLGATSTWSGSVQYGSNPRLVVGEDYRAASRNSNTEISLAIVANRAWTTKEVAWLSENYKTLIIDETPYLPFQVITTFVTLVVPGLTQTQSLDAIALTQQNTLANTNIAQAQILSTPELSIAVTLITANISTDQTLTNIELAQANILTTTNLSSNQNLDNIALIQQNIIAINELSTSNSISNIDLIQQHLLSISGLLSTTTIDNIVLAQQNTISVSNINETNSFTNIELSLADILELSNLLATTTYSGVTLTQQNVITIDNITSTAALDIINLIQQNSLALNDLAVSAALSNITLGQDYTLTLSDLQTASTLQNIVLSSSIVLDVNNSIQTITFSSPELTAASILVVSPMLHNVITTHLHLSLGGLLLEGNFIYMLGRNSNVYVVKSI